MDTFHLLLSFPTNASRQDFINAAPLPENATITWAERSTADLSPAQPDHRPKRIVTDADFNDLTTLVSATLRLEYGDVDWPDLPYPEWSTADRRELLTIAVSQWEYSPGEQFREYLFLEAFSERALEHLGNLQ